MAMEALRDQNAQLKDSPAKMDLYMSILRGLKQAHPQRYAHDRAVRPTSENVTRWSSGLSAIETSASCLAEDAARDLRAHCQRDRSLTSFEVLLDPAHYATLREFAILLAPLKTYTMKHQAEKYPTLSQVWPGFTALLAFYGRVAAGNYPSLTSAPMRRCAQVFLDGLTKRAASTVLRPVTHLAIICDIRFKQMTTVAPRVRVTIRRLFGTRTGGDGCGASSSCC